MHEQETVVEKRETTDRRFSDKMEKIAIGVADYSLENFQKEIDSLKEKLREHEWIPITSRLPIEKVRIDIWTKKGRITNVEYIQMENTFLVYKQVGPMSDFQDDDIVDYTEFESVTHWKSIPRSPI